MKIVKLGNRREIHIHSDRFSVYTGDCRLFAFWIECRVNTVEKTDSDCSVALECAGENEYVWAAESSLWGRKEYKLKLFDNCFTFTVSLSGSGAVGDIDFFRGSAECVGSAFGAAGYLLVNSQNRDRERSKFLVDVQPAEIIPLRAAPAPFVFPFWNDISSDWFGVGVAAKRGENNYQCFRFNAPRNGWSENGCWFTLPMQGYTVVDGAWTSPAVWFGFGADDMGVIEKYSHWQYEKLSFGRVRRDTPDWWKKPMFCGWGAQCELRDSGLGGKAPDYANEKVYSAFSDKLDEIDLHPGIIMIDDKWQESYGTLVPDKNKWISLRGFADSQHEKGRRVVLWLKCWDREGLPDDECIFVGSEPYCADPTNPKYLGRLEKAIHNLLSADDGECNCDGFKIDFMDCFPRMAGAVAYEKGVYGLEMMKRLFDAVCRFSKQAKPDAVINISCAHPYFAENCDQFRLHDYDPGLRSPLSIMRFRSEFADAVMPGVLIDTDGFKAYTAREMLRVLSYSAVCGIPDLYSFPSFFGASEWAKVRDIWNEYSEKTITERVENKDAL